MTGDKVPYFIQMRGCINCSVSKAHKERHGTDYGFHHESVIGCIILECYETASFTVANPFIDPEEVMISAKKQVILNSLQMQENIVKE